MISLGSHYTALRSIINRSQIKLANPYIILLELGHLVRKGDTFKKKIDFQHMGCH